MTVIELGNQFSTLIGASHKSQTLVDTMLAVETPGHTFTASYKAGHWDGMTRFLKKNKFPTGLLSEVVLALRRAGDEPEIVDKRTEIGYTLPEEIKLAHAKLGHITLRDYQYEAVTNALQATRGIVNVATNGGKTEIACGIIQSILPNLKKEERIVFFTHAKEIFTQSVKRIEERLGIKVGVIGNGKWDVQQVTVVMIPTIKTYVERPKDLTNVKKYKDLKDNVDLLRKALRGSGLTEEQTKKYKEKQKIAKSELEEYRAKQWAIIDERVEKTQELLSSIVAFLGDEVHHASSDTWYKVFMSLENAYYRFGLTGTVDEDNEINLKRLLGCTGKIVIKISNDFLIEEGHSAKPTIYFLPVNAKPIDNVDYQTARYEGIIRNEIRNKVFVEKILERAKFGKQCLIIVNETEHAELVLGMMEHRGVNVKVSHGDKPDKYREEVLEELRDGSLQVLIATTILDEGVDVSGINCLFLMAGGKSMRQVLQRIGRGLRKKDDGSGLEVYDALDYHNEYLVDHTLDRYNTYKAEKFSINKLT